MARDPRRAAAQPPYAVPHPSPAPARVRASQSSPTPARLLVYRPGAIGDFILALPALAALRARFPGATLTVVGPAAALPLAAPLADVTLAADDPRLTPLFVSGAPASPPVADERRGTSRLSHSAAAFSPLADLTHAVVWAGAAAEPLVANLRAAGAAVVHAPSRPPEDRRQHVADYLVATLAPLGVTAAGPAVPRVQPRAAARARAAAFLAAEADAVAASADLAASARTPLTHADVSARAQVRAPSADPAAVAARADLAAPAEAPPPTRWVALHLGSGSPRKNWPVTGFVAVAAGLTARGLRPLVVAGPAEGEAVAEALGALAPWRPALARDWPLDDLAALLGACAGYVGADSGITHLAAAAGASVVAIFGPTDPARWAPRGPRVTVVQHAVPCQPCTWAAMWACPHRACLTALAPDAVLAAAVECFGLAAG